jgi:hypothetical protein
MPAAPASKRALIASEDFAQASPFIRAWYVVCV